MSDLVVCSLIYCLASVSHSPAQIAFLPPTSGNPDSNSLHDLNCCYPTNGSAITPRSISHFLEEFWNCQHLKFFFPKPTLINFNACLVWEGLIKALIN